MLTSGPSTGGLCLEAWVRAGPYYRAEFHFMAGWIALRFLADPARALEHFTHVDEGSNVTVRVGCQKLPSASMLTRLGS
jgi:hypothetical protein